MKIKILIFIVTFFSTSHFNLVAEKLFDDQNRIKELLKKYGAFRIENLEKGHNLYFKTLELLEVKKNVYQTELINKANFEYEKTIRNYTNLLNKVSKPIQHQIYFNLALISYLHSGFGDKNSQKNYEKSLIYLENIPIEWHFFANRHLFMKASLYELLGQNNNAINLYKYIGEHKDSSPYIRTLSNIYYSDSLFKRDLFGDSLRGYQAISKNLNESLAIEKRELAGLRSSLNYRKMWAGYRSFNLNQALKSSLSLLGGEIYVKNRKRKVSMAFDAKKILSDVLFERNEFQQTISSFEAIHKEIDRLDVGLLIAGKYSNIKKVRESSKILSYLLENYPLSYKTPIVVLKLSDNHQKLGNENQKFHVLLNLFHIFGKNSLWRAKNEKQGIKEYITDNQIASKLIDTADHYYRNSLKLENPRKSKEAIIFYETLNDYFVTDRKTKSDWLFRMANLHFYLENFSKSYKLYSLLVDQIGTSLEIKKISSKQLVNISYRKWSKFNIQTAQNNQTNRDFANNLLNIFFRSLSEYLESKYFEPNSSIVLVGAETLSDNSKTLEAEKIWHRLIEGASSLLTKEKSLRALLEYKLKKKKYYAVLKVIENYSFTNSKAGKKLRSNEIVSIYETTLLKTFRRIKSKGSTLEASDFLFKKIKNYENYLTKPEKLTELVFSGYALSGNWHKISSAFHKRYSHRKSKINIRPEIYYLYCKATDKLMYFEDAAILYHRFAMKHPRFSKKNQILERSLLLAESSGLLPLAAGISEYIAFNAPSNKKSVVYLKKAANFFEKGGMYQKATKLYVKLIKKISKYEHPKIYLKIAKNHIKQKNVISSKKYLVKAIEEIKKFSVRRENIKWKKTLAESYYLLSLNQLNEFNKLRLSRSLKSVQILVRKKIGHLKKIKNWSRQIISYGDSIDRSRINTLMSLVTLEFSEQIREHNYKYSKKLSTTEILYLQKISGQLDTLSESFNGKVKIDSVLANYDKIIDSKSEIFFAEKLAFSKKLISNSDQIFLPGTYGDKYDDSLDWAH